MAKQEHIDILCKGVEPWNEWRSENTKLIPDLSEINLYDAVLTGINLNSVNLAQSNLSQAKLNNANLKNACLVQANLDSAFLNNSDLSQADLRWANLSWANLEQANLCVAKLEGANLSNANLHDAQCIFADLSNVVLDKAQVQDVDFTGAKFTGACLGNWEINNQTRFEDVDCRYVYLEVEPTFFGETFSFKKRCPVSGEFTVGEFSKLFRKSLNTLNLSFYNGVEYEAFIRKVLKAQAELKGNQALIHKVETQENSFVINLRALPEKSFSSSTDSLLDGRDTADFNYTLEQRQILAKAAMMTQQLLYRMAQGNVKSNAQASATIRQVLEPNSEFKTHLRDALRIGGVEAISVIFNHPLFSISAETVKGWLEAE